MAKIVLHQWLISPYCGKVRKALAAKRLAYEVVEYPGLLAAKAKRMGVGLLPVLDYDDQRLNDSTVILRFLEQRHPDPPLWPEDPRDRALAELLEDWSDEALFWCELYFRLGDPVAARKTAALLSEGRPAYERSIMRVAAGQVFKRKSKAQGIGLLDEATIVATTRGHFDRIEALLGEGEWLVGGRRSIADLAIAAQLDEFVRTSRFADELRGRERLWAWLQRNAD
ncbi:glutathione S-transferase family protein [Nannocystaceae bacterium ST9]